MHEPNERKQVLESLLEFIVRAGAEQIPTSIFSELTKPLPWTSKSMKVPKVGTQTTQEIEEKEIQTWIIEGKGRPSNNHTFRGALLKGPFLLSFHLDA